MNDPVLNGRWWEPGICPTVGLGMSLQISEEKEARISHVAMRLTGDISKNWYSLGQMVSYKNIYGTQVSRDTQISLSRELTEPERKDTPVAMHTTSTRMFPVLQ